MTKLTLAGISNSILCDALNNNFVVCPFVIIPACQGTHLDNKFNIFNDDPHKVFYEILIFINFTFFLYSGIFAF